MRLCSNYKEFNNGYPIQYTLVQIYQRSLFHVVYLHRLQKLQNALLILSALHYQNLCFTYSNRCFCCFGAFLILTNIYDFVSKRPLPA